MDEVVDYGPNKIFEQFNEELDNKIIINFLFNKNLNLVMEIAIFTLSLNTAEKIYSYIQVHAMFTVRFVRLYSICTSFVKYSYIRILVRYWYIQHTDVQYLKQVKISSKLI